ncbi:MAG: zinc ribbon domain-containing protein [Acidobacteriota bacterium]
MFCPKCAAQTVSGQRFCKNCGTNIGVIVDAIDRKQPGPIDFETLKKDLRELGSNLRAGFEQFKGTHRLDKQQGIQPTPNVSNQPGAADLAQEIHKSIKRDIEGQVNKGLSKVRVANSRKYSLQQATLSVFSGGAWMTAWFYILEGARNSGLFTSIEQVIFDQTGSQIHGLDGIFRFFWLLGLISVARGVGHLVNGIFFAPKQEQQVVEEPVFQPQSYHYSPAYPTPVSAVPPASHIAGTTTNELNQKAGISQPSVTEEATLRLEDARPQS